MATNARTVQVYEALANWYDRQGQAKLRDWFLVLAADSAMSAGLHDHAEHLRQRLLHVNPHHLLRPFSSFGEALQSPDVRGYIADLRRTYPPESAEQLLQSTQKKSGPGEADDEATAFGTVRDHTPERKVIHDPPPASVPSPSPSPSTLPRPPRANPPKPQPRPAFSPRPAPANPPAVFVGEKAEISGLSYWVPTLLFDVLLLGSITLAVYLFARPFLPR